MPKVSIITPTYNRSAMLAQAIKTVLAQTFADFELIIIDDGSTDDTQDVVYSFEDDRVVYVWQENQQRCAARNNGLARAAGEYVAFLDSDDLWFPNKLERQLEAFSNHPNAGLVFSGCARVDEHIRFLNPPELLRPERESVKNMHSALLLRNQPAICATMVKKSLMDKVGGFDPSLPHAEDWDMWIRLSQLTPFCEILAPLAAYRVHAGARTSNPQTTIRGDMVIINKHHGNPTEPEAQALKTRAEMFAYTDRAAEAAIKEMPEAREWLNEAQRRAQSLNEPAAVAERLAWHFSFIRTDYSWQSRNKNAHHIREYVSYLRTLGSPLEAAESLQAFWETCARQCYLMKDHKACLVCLARYYRACGLRTFNPKMAAFALRTALKYACMEPRVTSLPQEAQIRRIIGEAG